MPLAQHDLFHTSSIDGHNPNPFTSPKFTNSTPICTKLGSQHLTRSIHIKPATRIQNPAGRITSLQLLKAANFCKR
jgi:hypothetical protein